MPSVVLSIDEIQTWIFVFLLPKPQFVFESANRSWSAKPNSSRDWRIFRWRVYANRGEFHSENISNACRIEIKFDVETHTLRSRKTTRKTNGFFFFFFAVTESLFAIKPIPCHAYRGIIKQYDSHREKSAENTRNKTEAYPTYTTIITYLLLSIYKQSNEFISQKQAAIVQCVRDKNVNFM